MKKNIYIILALFMLTITSVFVVSCDIKSPTEGLAVIVSTIERQTTVTVNISNPEGLNVTSPVTVKFTGPDSSKVIDEVNKKITSLTTSDGSLIFAIKDGTVISEASPVKLVLQLRSVNKDYLDVDYPVTINATGFQNFYVKMIKKAELKAAGVEQITNAPTTGTTDPTTGTVTTPVNISTPTGTVVSIPQGAVLKDNSGTPLSGKLTVSVTTYSSQATGLLPGSTVTMKNSSYVSALAFSCQVTDQNGRTAATFGNSNSSIALPVANVTNPSTGKPFEAGDKGEFYYLDANGNPKSLGQATVQLAKVSGNNSAALSKTSAAVPFFNFSLSDFQQLLGAYIYMGITKENLTYAFDFGANYNPNNVRLELKLTPLIGSVIRYPVTTQAVSYKMPQALLNAVVTMAGSPVEVSAVKNIPSYTSKNDLPVTYSGLKYFDIFVQGKCPNDNTKLINPTIAVSVAKGGISYGTINLVNGRGGIYLKDDGTYTLSATYNGKDYPTTVTVSGQNVSLSSSTNVVPMPDAGPGKVHYFIMTTEACD